MGRDFLLDVLGKSGSGSMRNERNFEINESYSWEPDACSHSSWTGAMLWSSAFLLGLLFWQIAISILAWMMFAR